MGGGRLLSSSEGPGASEGIQEVRRVLPAFPGLTPPSRPGASSCAPWWCRGPSVRDLEPASRSAWPGRSGCVCVSAWWLGSSRPRLSPQSASGEEGVTAGKSAPGGTQDSQTSLPPTPPQQGSELSGRETETQRCVLRRLGQGAPGTAPSKWGLGLQLGSSVSSFPAPSGSPPALLPTHPASTPLRGR